MLGPYLLGEHVVRSTCASVVVAVLASLHVRPPIVLRSYPAPDTLRAIPELRGAHNLGPLESDKLVADLGPNRLFFLRGSMIQSNLQTHRDAWWQFAHATRTGDTHWYFASWLGNDSLTILAYVNGEAASGVTRLDGTTRHSITLSPRRWPMADTLLFVPAGRLIGVSVRSVEIDEKPWSMDVLDASLE